MAPAPSFSPKASTPPAWARSRGKPACQKGTLYVYFDSKEVLFQAIVEEECQAQAEQVFCPRFQRP
jgi:hypothetical protein